MANQRIIQLIGVQICVVLYLPLPICGQWQIAKIADTNTVIPNSSESFSSFQSVAMDGGIAVFSGKSNSQAGVYSISTGSSLNTIADTSTTMTGSNDLFADFGSVGIDGNNIAFLGDNSSISRRGIYRANGNSLDRVVDTSIFAPQGSGQFSTLALGHIDGTGVGFWGFVPFSPTFSGIYKQTGGSLQLVANQSTNVPGSNGSFQTISSNLASGNGNSGFFAFDASFARGLYAEVNGNLEKVADNSTFIPGSTDTFQFNSATTEVAINGDTIMFVAHDDDFNGSIFEESGIFQFENGLLTTLLDQNDIAPNGSAFDMFLDIAADDNDYVFKAIVDGDEGIYAMLNGQLSELIEVGDILDGKQVDSLFLDPDGFGSEQLGFRVGFQDGTQGVFAASPTAVPEPAGYCTWSLLACAFVVMRRKKRCSSKGRRRF